MKLIEKLINTVGNLEEAVYGNTLEGMARYERKDARNELREEIMLKFGYQYRYTDVNQGHWEPVTPTPKGLDKRV